MPGKHQVWAIGERTHARLIDAGLPLTGVFVVPNSVKGITRWSGRFSWGPRSAAARLKFMNFIFFTTVRPPRLLMSRQPTIVAARRNWRRKLDEVPWPTGDCPKLWGKPRRPCGRWSVNIFSSLFFGLAQNLYRAKTQADWQRCNAPTRTSMDCWKISTGHSTVCARAGSMRNCSTSSPASSAQRKAK